MPKTGYQPLPHRVRVKRKYGDGYYNSGWLDEQHAARRVELERGDGSGRTPQSGESISGAALLRSTLEALECLLGEHRANTHSSDTDIDYHLSPYGRRAIRDMVLGPLYYWLGTNPILPRSDRWEFLEIQYSFRVVLDEWVVRGAESRELLQSRTSEFLDLLDGDVQRKREESGVQLSGIACAIEDEGDDGSDPDRAGRTQAARDKLKAGL